MLISRSLTNYHLKVLAALFMVIDHMGAVFFPELDLLRFIGRFSFPLFGWLLVQGEAHTRDFGRYLIRLLLLGLISQPIYAVTFEGESRYNILFTLAIGLVCLRLARRFPQFELPAWLGGAVLAQLTDTDYGAYGIGMIALIRHFKPDGLWWTGWLLLHLALVLAIPWMGASQFPAVLAPGFFYLATLQQGTRARWFYLFYPGHLLVLLAIDRLIG